jgi:hypothetical protein
MVYFPVCDFLYCSNAQKVDEASHFAFVQFIKQEQGLYDHNHPDYAQWDKVDFEWKRISH